MSVFEFTLKFETTATVTVPQLMSLFRSVHAVARQPYAGMDRLKSVQASVDGVLLTASGPPNDDVLDMKIEDMSLLRSRQRGVLVRAGIRTYRDLVETMADDLLSLSDFGECALQHVRDELARYDLHLKGESPTP